MHIQICRYLQVHRLCNVYIHPSGGHTLQEVDIKEGPCIKAGRTRLNPHRSEGGRAVSGIGHAPYQTWPDRAHIIHPTHYRRPCHKLSIHAQQTRRPTITLQLKLSLARPSLFRVSLMCALCAFKLGSNANHCCKLQIGIVSISFHGHIHSFTKSQKGQKLFWSGREESFLVRKRK